MKRSARLLLAAFLAIPAGGAFSAGKAEETRILAQDLVTMRASNGLTAALWTRRRDSYTLQLVFGRGSLPPGSGPLAMVGQRMAPINVKAPETSVWLLRADGAQMRPVWSSSSPEKCTLRCIAVEVLYRFSIADGEQAIAAAVKIGDDFHIEKLRPLVQIAD